MPSLNKYYKKDANGHYNWDNLNNDVRNYACKCWQLKGITDREVLCDKLEKLDTQLHKWTYNQRIAVGNRYIKSITRLRTG